jgi:FkbM family methyltransferase
MRVTVPELASLQLYRFGFIEPDVTTALILSLEPGTVFVDVGAHHGYHSLVASHLVGEQGAVYAFEPSPASYDVLRRNVRELTNVHVHPVAADATRGNRLLFDFGPRHSSLNTLLPTARVPPAERRGLRSRQQQVETVVLDSFFAQRNLRPDFVKIDAESSELDVLRGMRHALRHAAPVVALEVGDYDDATLSADCIEFLGWLGYRGFEYDGERFVPHERRDTYAYDNLFFARADTSAFAVFSESAAQSSARVPSQLA